MTQASYRCAICGQEFESFDVAAAHWRAMLDRRDPAHWRVMPPLTAAAVTPPAT